MKREQYARANKAVFISLMIIMVYLAVTLSLALLVDNNRTWRVTVQVIASILAIIVNTVAFKTKRDSRQGAIMILVSTTVAYSIILLVNQMQDTWLYTMPIVLASLAYLESKLVIMQNVTLGIVNVIRLFLLMPPGDKDYEKFIFMAIFVLILQAIVSISLVRILMQFNKENVSSIEIVMEEQKGNSTRIIQTADDLASHFEQAMQMMTDLEKSVGNTHFAMSNIAESTVSTAESVQSQTEMCVTIQESTDNAKEQSMNMMQASAAVTQTVEQGAKGIEELKEQARNVEEAGNRAVEVISRLTEQVEKVQGFVGSIINISNQTNLLSLNASIEAARAGEAGKGFAVVADEIRQLSDQTKEASNKITSIIQELNEDTQLANESIEDSVASMKKQNEMIGVTGDRFQMINEKAVELSNNVQDTNEIIKGILEATTAIADSLQNLSSTSEEVAVSSAEGLKNTETAVEDMNQCKEVLTQINNIAQSLKQSI